MLKEKETNKMPDSDMIVENGVHADKEKGRQEEAMDVDDEDAIIHTPSKKRARFGFIAYFVYNNHF